MTFADLVEQFLSIINAAIPLIFAVTLLTIIWKVAQAWVFTADPKTREEGKKTVLIAIIVLTVMTGIWGILAILTNSLFN